MKRPSNSKSPPPPKIPSDQDSLATALPVTVKTSVPGELVGGVAHDFNNLLSIFHGYTEILQTELAPGDPLQEYLGEMMAAVERAKTLTSQLLNFSRPIQSAPRPLRVESVLLEFRKMLRRMVGEHIELVLTLEEECGWVMADPRQIETVLTQLVGNACKAMPGGGRLSIELCEIALSPASRHVKAGLAAGPYVQIAVRDTSAEAKNAVDLGICTRIVEQTGGKIITENLPGRRGRTFAILLPRLPAPPEEKPRRTTPEVFLGKGELILIVEDDARVRKSLADRVRQLGCQALCAGSGDEALRILEAQDEIRLVITDIIMPILGGVELSEIVRRRWPAIKLVLTSGYAFDPPKNIISHSIPFLPKPISTGALTHTFLNLLNA